jgi:NADPH-dependent glutamate synthase beta subunit-like oxidoreductase
MTANILESLSDNIKVNHDKCVYCGICVDTCILDNLRMKLAPCRGACPLGVNCQGYVRLIARGDEEQAMVELEKTLPFHGVLGRICSQPCEDHCHRKKVEGEAVTIRALKRYISDNDPRDELPAPETAAASGGRAAVVGSGPAGMMAAYELALRGHDVTVFDADTEPGGMLRWAIPAFRLPEDVLYREIDRLKRMGVEFKQETRLGKDFTLEDLKAEHDALIVALGRPASRTLNVEGEDSQGVHYALEFLRKVRSGVAPDIGTKIVVIGGGDVALDTAQTALRLGAREVLAVCLEADEEMPAHDYVIREALDEGVRVKCSWGPGRIAYENGKVTGVEFKSCTRVFDEEGCFAPCFDESDTFFEPADTVIISIGQGPDQSGVEALCPDGRPEFDPLTLQSADEKVFLAGDMVTGPSSAVHAMAAGREAAVSADRLIRGEDLRYGRGYSGPIVTDFEIETDRGNNEKRRRPPRKSFQGEGDWDEIEELMDRETARRQAGRCYACGEPFGKHRTCWFCLPCEVECPHDAVWVEVPYLLR